ncbi:slit homolog 1 protein-like [Diachasmimorpha longicaudata]|uniref:slit homolog 1 protein-like n=1 Tax=Diachasmimorpha longicaudata TaxID=58733 RepID=UPI0030B91171
MWSGVLTILAGVIIAVDGSTSEIDLSYRHIKKEDFFVKIQHTLNFHELTELNLKGNEFDSFLDCSAKLDHLKSLDLAENQLQRFFFLCNDEYALEYLNISHNHLEYIDDQALNQRTNKLKVVDISHNRISVINETMIEHMKVLEFLSMAHNPVIDIHEKAFLTQKNLKHLDLANIGAEVIPNSLFRPLTNLTFLNISFNPITNIPFLPSSLLELDLSGTFILYPDNIILPQLARFHLNFMPNITGIVLNDFENFTMLEVLSMERCPILSEFRVWPPNNRILPRLHHLSVKGCDLETLNDDLRPIMQRIALVDLQNNPWHCDCRMQWVNRLNLSSELSREITCNTPEQHHGRLLSQIPNHDLVCLEISTTTYTAIWASMSVILIFLILTGVWLFWRGPLRHWRLPKRNGDTVSYKNVVESSNDLIRILVTDDRAEE